MRKFLLILLLLFAMSPALAQSLTGTIGTAGDEKVAAGSIPNAFFVAPTAGSPPTGGGLDSGAGSNSSNVPGATSYNAPFATINRCQTAMQNTSTKTCYIRAGTYTGSGNGYNTTTITANGGWQVKFSLYLTSSDNGETYQEYSPDFPSNGVSTAIFDGGAGTWSATGPPTGCGLGQNPTTAVTVGIMLNGTQNININGLQLQNYCGGGIHIHGNVENDLGCAPLNVSTSTGNTVTNNIIHAISNATQDCGASGIGGGAGIDMWGDTRNETITHNVLYNITGRGISALANQDSTASTEQMSGTVVSYNAIYSVVTNETDDGAIIVGNHMENDSPGIVIDYNYVHNYGQSANSTKGIYHDDGLSNSTTIGNVVFGVGSLCYFQHSGVNNVFHYNICDNTNVGANGMWAFNSSCYWTTSNGGTWIEDSNSSYCIPDGTQTWTDNIGIANTSSCSDDTCTYCPCSLDGSYTSGTGDNFVLNNSGNFYWNYNGAGNTIINNNATAQGDGNPMNYNNFSTCPTGLNSWGFVIPSGSPIITAGYQAQPSGWGGPGFWGPPGYSPPHDNYPVDGLPHAPSYGPC